MDDMEIDPAIAEAMGFTGFGGKKRKQGGMDEAFIDPETNKQPKAVLGKGANSTALGERHAAEMPADPSSIMPSKDKNDVAMQGPDATSDSQPSNVDSSANASPDTASLHALRHGVKNARGDMVYFQPSFLEDPWKDLRPS